VIETVPVMIILFAAAAPMLTVPADANVTGGASFKADVRVPPVNVPPTIAVPLALV
jgi:hypothetical protein